MAPEEKIVFDWSVLDDRLAEWRRQRLRIGFTNGCFDLIHPGHIKVLVAARACCDRLVVGLNSDASTRRLKGEDRPIQNEQARAEVLAALEAVDLVVVFDQDTDNVSLQQEGMAASKKRTETLGNYQEIRLRQFNQTLAKYMSKP